MLDVINFHPARYWHKLNDGRIQCGLSAFVHAA